MPSFDTIINQFFYMHSLNVWIPVFPKALKNIPEKQHTNEKY